MANDKTNNGRPLVLATALVRVGQASPAQACANRYPDAGFEAQVLGQPGQKRGLRGGAAVLGAARGAYLWAEFAGAGDRRPAPGLLRVREV